MTIKEAMERSQAAAVRLRDMGYDVPEMPKDNRFQTAVCSLCGGRGKREVDGKVALRCTTCDGSGVIVIAPLVEWNTKLAAILEEVKLRGGC